MKFLVYEDPCSLEAPTLAFACNRLESFKVFCINNKLLFPWLNANSDAIIANVEVQLHPQQTRS